MPNSSSSTLFYFLNSQLHEHEAISETANSMLNLLALWQSLQSTSTAITSHCHFWHCRVKKRLRKDVSLNIPKYYRETNVQLTEGNCLYVIVIKCITLLSARKNNGEVYKGDDKWMQTYQESIVNTIQYVKDMVQVTCIV